MKSMTGYGYACGSTGDFQIEVELKGYNNRYLEINTSMHSALASYEQMVAETIRKRVMRGKVDVSIRLKIFNNESTVHVDMSLLDGYLRAFEEIREARGLQLSPGTSDLLAVDGLFTTTTERDPKNYEPMLEDCLGRALDGFCSSREREGEATRLDLVRLGRSLQSSLDSIRAHVDSYESYFRDMLLERYRELGISNRYDEAQMLQEIGLLLVKYSINEEQNRLATHLNEYFRLLECGQPVGKRLDFLCQEMNREVNTTASKSQNVDITLCTVQMKDDLENIREQIRNIE